jgi:hypothetical protein
VEFSPELHRIAQENIRKDVGRRKCGLVESVCADFLDFPLPCVPCVFFFFDPCDDPVLKHLLARIHESLQRAARTVYLIYVAPTEAKKIFLDSTAWLVNVAENIERNYCVYQSR